MSETKFTKGEWSTSSTHHGYEVMSMSESARICNVCAPSHGNTPGTRANAHLIAAAPELYEMVNLLSTELLHMIRAENSRRLQGAFSTDLDEPDYLDEESVYLAQKLLAKARGEK